MGIVLWYTAEQELKDSYYLRVRQGVEDFCMKNAIRVVRIFPNEPDGLKQLALREWINLSWQVLQKRN